MSYILISDSTTDLGYEFMKNNNVPFLSLSYTIGDEAYNDDMAKNTDMHKFYEDMRNGAAIPVTTQINAEQYKAFFTPYLEAGQDVIYLCFSSGLSGSYTSAVNAQEELANKYPARKVEVIDSLAASMGEGLLLWDAVEKRDACLGFTELAAHIRKQVPRTNHWFTVDDLNHLYRGGRVSKTSAVLGAVLNIKPILNVDDAGRLIPIEKVRGRKKALIALAEKVEKYIVDSEAQTILISHGDCEEEARFTGAEIAKRVKVKGFYYSTIGPVIGAHSGPGTISVFFFGASKGI